MTGYLLDTNIVSELRKRKPHGAVLEWINNQRDDQLFMSAVSLGELQIGIERTKKQDLEKAKELENWLDHVAQAYEILPMDILCFREWGRLMSAKSDDLIEDGMIAATARVHGLTVATRNEKDFHHFEVPTFNPFALPR